jgi:RNA polymerase sigma factor (sigma-70 family)
MTSKETWCQYINTGRPVELRNRIVEENLDLVEWRLSSPRWRSFVRLFGRDELRSFGMEAVISAVEKYDPGSSSSAKFSTYAVNAIDMKILTGTRHSRTLKRSMKPVALPQKDEDHPLCRGVVEDLNLIDINDAIPKAMCGLTYKQRSCVEGFLEGLTFREIGESRGLSESGAKESYKKFVAMMKLALSGKAIPKPYRKSRPGPVIGIPKCGVGIPVKYNNVDDASAATGISRLKILKVLRGDNETTGGFAWRWN